MAKRIPPKRIEPNDPATKSADVVGQNVDELKRLFPEALTEGKLDFDVLRQLLGGEVDDETEKYGLTWHGKKRARALALTPSTGTLLPAPDESVDWDTTKNVFIEGDNLEVLKLLQKAYAGKVKVVYIDPPYNTGNDFVYPDDFRDGIKNYLEITGQVEGGRRLSSNSEASGRFHTDWLNMMYPRLKLAHALLKQDGAIFVSCDENELPRLRSLLEDIFGTENFVADMVWAAGRKNDSTLISVSHEYIVCFARSISTLKERKIEWRQRKKGLDAIYEAYEKVRGRFGKKHNAITEAMKEWYRSLPDSNPAKAHKHYSQSDNRGLYFPDNISWPGGGGPKYEVLHPRTKKPVEVPSRGWMTSDPAKMQQWIAEDRVHFGPDESYVPCIKSYLKDREYSAPYSVFYQDGRAATKRLRELMGGDCFDYPKDELVLQEIVEMMTSGDDVIVDFFAGSGTTAHSVWLQNAADQGTRTAVLVQLPEPLDPEVPAQTTAVAYCRKIRRPLALTELAKERLRRAGKALRKESPMFAGDVGFRVYKLAESNIRAWDPQPADMNEALFSGVQNVREGRNANDLLAELCLKLGIELSATIETRTIARRKVNAVAGGVLLACLSEDIDGASVEPLAEGIATWLKELAPADSDKTDIVVRDSAFEDDVAKVNFAAILQQHGIASDRIRSV